MTQPTPAQQAETQELIDSALDAAKARLEEDGCDCGDHNDPPCALCLVERAIAALRAAVSPQATVTRLEVIDGSGRVLTRHDITAELSYQDAGRTLKVFLTERGNTEASEQHRREFTAEMKQVRAAVSGEGWRESLVPLLLALEKDFETEAEDDEPVASGVDGPCALTFGMIRHLRKVVSFDGKVPLPATPQEDK